MSDLLNSNGSAPNNKPFYVLASSGSLILALATFYLINKKKFVQNENLVIALATIAAVLFSAFIVLYIIAWVLVAYPSPKDDKISEINHNYLISAISLLATPLILSIFLFIINKQFKKENFEEALFDSILYTIAAYTFLGLSYYLTLSVEDSYSFPLESGAMSNVHLESANKKSYLIWASVTAGLGSLLLLFFTILDKKFPIFNLKNYPIIKNILIVLGFSLLILSSTLFLNFTDKDERYAYSLIPLGLFVIFLFSYYYLNGKDLDIYFYLSMVLFISWTFFIVTLYSLNATSEDLRNNYTFFLIVTSFITYAALLISLSILSFYNSYQIGTSNEILISLGLFILVSLIFTVWNSYYISELDIKNSTSLDNVTLSDGTKAKDFKDSGFDTLKFSMAFNYFAIFWIGLILSVGFVLIKSKSNKTIFNISEFMLLKSKLKYNIYALGLLLISLFLVCGGLATGFIYIGSKEKDFFTSENFTESYWLPVAIITSIFLLTYVIEYSSNLGYDEKEHSTIVLQILRSIVILFPLIAPIISIISYFIDPPKFLEQIQSSTGTDLLIFGDTQDKNAAPFIDNKIDRSQFSVSSNFVTSGNGLFVTGGRSSLDLNTTRNIIYLDNQQNYFNSKFQYNTPNQENASDFQFIEKDGLNLFSLESNQISYGNNNNNTNNSFWVAVGENVGLGNNGSILYNTKAGSNGTNDIPYLDTFNDWQESDSGAFEYKGNGVISGIKSGSNRWVAVGQNKVDFAGTSNIKYSDDGKNWSNATGVSFSNYGNKVAFGPSGLKTAETFIAVGSDNNNNNILRSIDGIDWSSTLGVCFSGTGNDVVYGMSNNGTSGVWVAVGSDSNDKPVKYSTDDGITWADANGTFDFTKPEDALTVAYDLTTTTFTVAGKRGDTSILYNSVNGKDWTAEPLYNNYDEITALNYNLQNEKSRSNFNKVYYPYSNTQNFFVDKLESTNLKYFMIGNYVITIVLVLFFYFTIFKLNKDKYINSTGK